MSTYKEIKGFKVQTLSADPVTAGTSWSSGGNMNTARYNVGAAGTQTAALAYSGYAGAPVYGTTSPPSGSTNKTESYDGSSWTDVANLNQFRNHGISFGTQTAAILSSGISDYAPGPPYGRTTYTETESWNGSAWTEVNNIPTVLYRISAFGTSTAGITAAGAKNHPATDNSESYSWDGTNWTDGPNVNTPRSYQMGLGTSTAGMIVGGYIQSPASMVGNTEIWNGSAWTEVNDLNTARRSGGASKIGSTSEGIVFGGSTPPTTAKTEVYNGTSWSETADLSIARVGMPGGVGIGTSALCFGGDGPPELSATEEFSVSTIADTNKNLGQVYYNSTANAFKVTKTIFGTGAWASGGNMPSARSARPTGAGTQTASVVFGGNPAGNVTLTYNGTAFSTPGNNLSDGRYNSIGLGTSTAAFNVGGVPTSTPTLSADTESWNGTSWTEVAEINTGRESLSASGNSPISAAVVFGGNTAPAVSALTELWNGSSWSEVADMNTARKKSGGFGTSTSSIVAGGYISTNSNAVESWNGTSWTEVTESGTKDNLAASGTSNTSGLIFGGSPFVAVTQQWDGSSWTELADLATARDQLGGTGNSVTTALAFGGRTPGGASAVTEEWTAPSSVGNQTIGTS